VVVVPEVVRNNARTKGAGEWLDALPATIASLEVDWGFRVGEAYPDATEALVAEATLDDGAPAVLKLIIPGPGAAAARELAVLQFVNGDGCPLLYRSDLERGAMLMERLGRPMRDLGIPIDRRQRLLCAAARRLWRQVDGLALPTGADKARSLIDSIHTTWERLGRPIPEDVVAHATLMAERRIAAHDPSRSVLVHGDVHEWNALESADGFKLADPDGLIAEPEYDLGVMMREDPVELMAGEPLERATRLAMLTGCDPAAIWEWGVAERVANGLLLTEIDVQPVGRQMLEAAVWAARVPA
jgi:streptomycin 6-kinase